MRRTPRVYSLILSASLIGTAACRSSEDGIQGGGTDAGEGTGLATASSGTASSDGGSRGSDDGSGGSSGSGAGEGSEGSSGGSEGNTSETAASDGTATTGGAEGSSTTAGVGESTTGVDECMTVACGMPAVCCAAGQECVSGMCVAACPSGIRCGDDQSTCCGETEVCVSDSCAVPTGTCVDSYDCGPGNFCEPTLGECLPQPDPLTCELTPMFGAFDVTLEWSHEVDHVISIPVVADLDGDGVPEAVINTTHIDNDWRKGLIVVLSGATGAELLRIADDPLNDAFASHGRSTIAVADVNGDSLPDIVYAGRQNGADGNRSLIHAYDHLGTRLWTSHDTMGADYGLKINNAAISLANLDDDPEAEVVIGGAVLDNDGLVVWDTIAYGDGNGDGSFLGTNSGYTGGISAIADLDGDMLPEIVSGKDAFKVSWTPGAMGMPPVVDVTPYWSYLGPAGDGNNANDGYPAIADFDLDGTPEVVLVASSEVLILNGQTGELWCGVDATDAMCVADGNLRTQPLAIPGGGKGGPPTVADFDGDGRAEVGVAGGASYAVYDANRSGEVVVQPMGDPVPGAGQLFVRWSNPTQDLSSNATGSSVFDFEGDGVAEVVYGDECFMRVYGGADGAVLLEIENSTATIHEYPLVVDVDADGNSEIMIVATADSGAAGRCNTHPGYAPRQGVFVYGDVNDRWVPTRRVWNQNAYHVTNISASGTVPMTETDNWTTAGLNNYRQNVQGEGVFNAPDLQIDLSADLSECSDDKLHLVATVRNRGALGVAAGIEVRFFEGADAGGTLLGTAVTTKGLLPGASEDVRFTLPGVPDGMFRDYFADVDGATLLVAECVEDNNDGVATDIGCLIPG